MKDKFQIDIENMNTDIALSIRSDLSNDNYHYERTSSEVIKVGVLLEDFFANGKFNSNSRQEIDNAAIFLDNHLKQNPNDPFAHMNMGLYYSGDIRFEKALDHYIMANQNTPENWALKSILYTKIGNTYFKLNNYDLGEHYHRKAIKTDPKNVSSYLCLATHNKIQENYEMALEYVKEAESITPESRLLDVAQVEMQILFAMMK